MQKVEAIGPTNAAIVIVGEAPGETEEKLGVPFVGMAGKCLDDLLHEVGINREDCYITNVYKYRPKGNDFTTIDKNELTKAYSELEAELMLVRPNVIVPLGNEAMKAVLGYAGISNYRGSVLESKFGKVIPTYHPAAITREWSFRPISALDWRKIKEESEYADIRRKVRNLIINPSFNLVDNFLSNVLLGHDTVAFDIETETNQITCIAFAVSPTNALCVPFWFGSSGSLWSEEEEQRLWKLIKQVLEDSSVPKIAQNAQYDMTILRDLYGITVNGLALDTMIAFHAVYPELPKGLDLLTSIYTDVPYYKYQRKTSDMNEFFRYNAMDAAVTYECAQHIHNEMEEFGVTKFYYEHMHSLILPLMDITHTGVRIDTKTKKLAVKCVETEIEALKQKLVTEVGHELNPNSPKQMKAWLYEELKLPVKHKLRKAVGVSTVSADEEALRSLYRTHKIEALKTILELRDKIKLISTYLEVNYDKTKDDTGEILERARTSYLITGTETGRLSSRETVYRTGTNLQNIPKGIARRIFIPDAGKIFINGDLSQAEARVVAYLAGEDRLIKVFNTGGDIHRKNAANVFRKREEDVTKDEREIAKRVVHAAHYMVGPITFSKATGVSVPEAKHLLNSYFAEYPRIKLWHMQIANQLKKTRTLTTPLGRKRMFLNRWNDALLREAVAFLPQSVVADVLNMGLRKLYEETKGSQMDILLQIHDAVLCQTPIEQTEQTCEIVKCCLSMPITINYRTFTIPVDISVGENWDALKKVL